MCITDPVFEGQFNHLSDNRPNICGGKVESIMFYTSSGFKATVELLRWKTSLHCEREIFMSVLSAWSWLMLTVFHVAVTSVSCLSSAEIKRDWSDHALWWEQKQCWLLRTAWTLEKYGIHADAKLFFMPQHKPLRLCLPNGITLRLRACFSNPVFQTVMGICRMLSEPQLLSLSHSVFLSFFLSFCWLSTLHPGRLNMC